MIAKPITSAVREIGGLRWTQHDQALDGAWYSHHREHRFRVRELPGTGVWIAGYADAGHWTCVGTGHNMDEAAAAVCRWLA